MEIMFVSPWFTLAKLGLRAGLDGWPGSGNQFCSSATAAEGLRATGICIGQERFQAKGLLARPVFDLRRSAFIRTGRGRAGWLADVAPRFEQVPSRKLICYFGQGQRILMHAGGKVSCSGGSDSS